MASQAGLFCYQCERFTQEAAQHSQAGDRVCPACSSDFIEITSRPPVRPRALPAFGQGQQQAFAFPGGDMTFSIGSLPFNFPQAFPSPAAPSPGGGGAGTGGFQVGDFAFGGLEQILQQLTEHYQPAFQGTARTTLETMPRLKVPTAEQHSRRTSSAKRATEEDEPSLAACKPGEACTVCHDEFTPGLSVIQLPCKHCFHDGCIRPWLEGHNTCPVCRTELPAEPSRSSRQPAGGVGVPTGQGPGLGAAHGLAPAAANAGGLAGMVDQLMGSFMASGGAVIDSSFTTGALPGMSRTGASEHADNPFATAFDQAQAAARAHAHGGRQPAQGQRQSGSEARPQTRRRVRVRQHDGQHANAGQTPAPQHADNAEPPARRPWPVHQGSLSEGAARLPDRWERLLSDARHRAHDPFPPATMRMLAFHTAIMRFQDVHGRMPGLDDLEDLAFDEEHVPVSMGFPSHRVPGSIPSTLTGAASSSQRARSARSMHSRPESPLDYGDMPELVHASEDEYEDENPIVHGLDLLGAELEAEPVQADGAENENEGDWETDDDDGFADPLPMYHADASSQRAPAGRSDLGQAGTEHADSVSNVGREVLFGDNASHSQNPIVSAAGFALRGVGLMVRSVGWLVGALLGPRH